MKLLIVAVLSLLPLSAGAQVGQYRGYAMSERILSERMLGLQSGISFANYLDSLNGNSLFSILDLLGTYRAPSVGQHEFRNGRPNSVNMLLWYLVLNSVAREVQSACTTNQGIPYTPSFQEALLKICQWPAAEAQSEAAMQNFWLALMGFDAPESEFQAWREFFLNSSYARLPGHQAVPAMVLAIVYNPHFLLRK